MKHSRKRSKIGHYRAGVRSQEKFFPNKAGHQSLWAGRLLPFQNAAQLANPKENQLCVPLSLGDTWGPGLCSTQVGTHFLPPAQASAGPHTTVRLSKCHLGRVVPSPPSRHRKSQSLLKAWDGGSAYFVCGPMIMGEMSGVVVKKPAGASLET